MKRRTLIAGLGSLTASTVFAVGSGAFTSVSAERTVTVETASDYRALLALTERGSGERSEIDGSQLSFDLPGDDEDKYPTGNPTDPAGLGSDSVYRFGQDAGSGVPGLFRVENLGTQPVEVYSTQTKKSNVPEVTMYDVETGNLLTKASPSPALSSGNELLCGLEVDTHGVPAKKTEYDVTLTINAVAADE